MRGLNRIGLLVLALLVAGPAAASSASAAGAASSAGAAVPAWTTYNHDMLRTATDPSSGSPVTPVPAWSAAAPLDGPVYAQPLVYGSRVYVATEHNTIYALRAATGAIVWHRSVGTPVPSGPCRAETYRRRSGSPAHRSSIRPTGASTPCPTTWSAAPSRTG